MALNKALEELLGQIKDEGKRNAARANFEEFPFLQAKFEDGLRQEDYDRNLNKMKADRDAEASLVKGYLEERDKWKTWAGNNVPKYNDLLKSYDDLEGKVKTLEEEKAALVLASAAGGNEGGNRMDPKELLKQVDDTIAKRGYIPKNKEELTALVAAEARKISEDGIKAERDAFFKTTVPSVMAELASMNNLQFKHRDEFGDMLDPEKFATFRTEKKILDINDAYDRFTFERREAKKYETIRKEEREKVEKEFASKMNLPGSGAPPATEFGPLQERSLGKNSGLDQNKPGWLEAAEAMRSEGKF
jgi:hypothetical protein